jgi:predicted nucleotidyltransferase
VGAKGTITVAAAPSHATFGFMSEASEIAPACAEIVEQRLREIGALCCRLNVQRLDLFGSAVTGRFDPRRSDLDFLVEFEPMVPNRYATACFELRTGLKLLF